MRGRGTKFRKKARVKGRNIRERGKMRGRGAKFKYTRAGTMRGRGSVRRAGMNDPRDRTKYRADGIL